jgi:hypothetical protein
MTKAPLDGAVQEGVRALPVRPNSMESEPFVRLLDDEGAA